MDTTLTQILNELEEFTKNHLQLKSFGFGALSNISTKDTEYPMLWVDVAPSNISGTQMVLSLNMYIAELQKQDMSNLKTIMSKTLLIGNDVVSKYWQNGEDEDRWAIMEDTVLMEPFEYKHDDVLAGWVFSIDVEIINRLSDCNLPLEND